MFLRGQRFTIVESSAKPRQHPAIGDCGYLRNAVLYRDANFGHLFIVVDALFSKFSKNGEGRCERKRFVLSNTLSTMIINPLKMGISGLRFEFTSDMILDNVLTLLLFQRSLNTGSGMKAVPLPTPLALFPAGVIKNDGDPRFFKFTICKIAPLPPSEIHTDKWERTAWIQAIRPTLSDLIKIFHSVKLPSKVCDVIMDTEERFNRYRTHRHKEGDIYGKHEMGFNGPEQNIRPDTLRIIKNVHSLQSFIVAVIKSVNSIEAARYTLLLKLRRRYNDYNTALDRVSREF